MQAAVVGTKKSSCCVIKYKKVWCTYIFPLNLLRKLDWPAILRLASVLRWIWWIRNLQVRGSIQASLKVQWSHKNHWCCTKILKQIFKIRATLFTVKNYIIIHFPWNNTDFPFVLIIETRWIYRNLEKGSLYYHTFPPETTLIFFLYWSLKPNEYIEILRKGHFHMYACGEITWWTMQG